MAYDQEVVSGVKQILDLFGPDRRINDLLNERVSGQPQRNHLLLNALADILEQEFLVVNQMEQSILGTMSALGLGTDTICVGDEENDYIISPQHTGERAKNLETVKTIVQALREDSKRCEEYDKTRKGA